MYGSYFHFATPLSFQWYTYSYTIRFEYYGKKTAARKRKQSIRYVGIVTPYTRKKIHFISINIKGILLLPVAKPKHANERSVEYLYFGVMGQRGEG